jgi:hypothetical protein
VEWSEEELEVVGESVKERHFNWPWRKGRVRRALDTRRKGVKKERGPEKALEIFRSFKAGRLIYSLLTRVSSKIGLRKL